MLALLIGLMVSPVQIERRIASDTFPQYADSADTGTILRRYPEYLKFALDVGRVTSPEAANQLQKGFDKLRETDEELAARFLRGLRFEMVQKLELVGLTPKRVTKDNTVMRQWVQKYMANWLREVDEYQFRAYADSVAKRPN